MKEYCIEHKCPCGKGVITEYHDDTPGFQEHTIVIQCKDCREIYTIDTSNGVKNWKLKKKA